MKISAISSVKNSTNDYSVSKKKNLNSFYSIQNQTNKPVKNFATNNITKYYNSNIINFGAKVLQYDFAKSGKSYLNYLSTCNENAEDIKNFLFSTLKGEDTRNSFIKEITKDPRQSKNIVKLLTTKLGGKVNFLKWYFAEDGYVENYEKYLESRYTNLSTIDDLIKIQPNWGYWALERKKCRLDGLGYNEDNLMRDQKVDFDFGTVPSLFKNKEKFTQLVESLKTFPFGEQNASKWLGDTYVIVSQLKGGDKSAKNIYKVTDPNNRERKYIIKMDRFYPEDITSSNPYKSCSAKEAKLIKGDSIYTDACLDYYLQLNGCNDNAKLLYYNFAKNAAIYEYIDGSETNQTKRNEEFIEQLLANNLFPDVNNLGIYLNDIGPSFNCCKDKSGNMRIIDIGHAEYLDLLKPGSKNLTYECSNLCGFSFKSALAGLNINLLSLLTEENNDNYAITTNKKETTITDNIDFNEFFKNRKETKKHLKAQIESMESTHGLYSLQSLNAHKKLKEFYEINIKAREKGYGKSDEDIILGLRKAINRENKIIKNIEENL